MPTETPTICEYGIRSSSREHREAGDAREANHERVVGEVDAACHRSGFYGSTHARRAGDSRCSGASSRRMRRSGRPASRASCARASVAPTTGRFLFSLVAPQTDCEVLEIGGSRGYSSIWLAAGVRYLGGSVLSLEHDPAKCEAWRRNVAEAGLEEWAELIEGDACETLAAIDDVFDVVFLDAEKEDYEDLFQLARHEARAGGRRRRRQRPLARGHARRVLARAAGGPDALERHRPARPRARAHGDPA